MSIIDKIDEAVGFLDKYELATAEKKAKKLYGNDREKIACYMEGFEDGYKKGYDE